MRCGDWDFNMTLMLKNILVTASLAISLSTATGSALGLLF